MEESGLGVCSATPTVSLTQPYVMGEPLVSICVSTGGELVLRWRYREEYARLVQLFAVPCSSLFADYVSDSRTTHLYLGGPTGVVADTGRV